MTRRDFGKGLAAILAAGVAPSVIADGYRRGLAAKIISMTEEKGADMETIVCTNGTMNCGESYEWVASLGLTDAILVRKEGFTFRNYELVVLSVYNGTVAAALRCYAGSINGAVLNTPNTSQDRVISPGAEFYVIRFGR